MNDGREGGFIKLHRRLRSWPLWQSMTALQQRVWIEMLFEANWKDGELWYGATRIPVKRGQYVTAEATLAELAKVDRQVVRDTYAKTEAEGSVTREKNLYGNRALTRVTIVHYERFQGRDDEENPPRNHPGTNEEPSENQARTPSEEGEEDQEGEEQAAAARGNLLRLPSALPSPAEVDARRWPAIEQLAQHLANLRGLTACPLTWPASEKRDRLESAIARATVARAAKQAYADWKQARADGKLVKSLGFFLTAIEALGQPGPGEEPLSDLPEWDAVLRKVRQTSPDAARRLAEAKARIEGGMLVLSAVPPLTDAIRELYWSRLQPLVKSMHGLEIEVEEARP